MNLNKTKIMLVQEYGQMANRMILVMHFIAYALDRKKSLKIYNFNQFIDRFDIDSLKSLEEKDIYFKKKHILIKFFVSFVYRFNWNKRNKIVDIRKEFDANEKTFDLSKLDSLNHTLIIPEGWLFRSTNLICQYENIITSVFKPNQNDLSQINDFWQKTNNSTTVIGIHIRRRDYREFNNGRYFYDNSVYLDRIKELTTLFNNEKIHIILFSDEEIDARCFNKSNISISKNSASVDFFLLSKCTFILGPPSTFSLVSAFLGGCNLFVMESSDQKLESMEQFIKAEI